MRSVRHVGLCAILAGSLGLVGCGGASDRLKVVPVEGIVSLGGEPLAGAVVSFVPEAAGKGLLSAIGTSDESGKFRLSAGSYVGLPEGKYKVAVTHYTMKDGSPVNSSDPTLDVEQLKFAGKLKQTVPREFSDLDRTSLRVEVAAGKSDGYDIAIDKK